MEENLEPKGKMLKAKTPAGRKENQKPTAAIKPTVKKEQVVSKIVINSERQSRLTKYAEEYKARKQALIEKVRKEEAAKYKNFRARSVPKYLKARKRELELAKSPQNLEKSPEVVQRPPKLKRRSKSFTDFERVVTPKALMETLQEPDEWTF